MPPSTAIGHNFLAALVRIGLAAVGNLERKMLLIWTAGCLSESCRPRRQPTEEAYQIKSRGHQNSARRVLQLGPPDDKIELPPTVERSFARNRRAGQAETRPAPLTSTPISSPPQSPDVIRQHRHRRIRQAPPVAPEFR